MSDTNNSVLEQAFMQATHETTTNLARILRLIEQDECERINIVGCMRYLQEVHGAFVVAGTERLALLIGKVQQLLIETVQGRRAATDGRCIQAIRESLSQLSNYLQQDSQWRVERLPAGLLICEETLARLLNNDDGAQQLFRVATWFGSHDSPMLHARATNIASSRLLSRLRCRYQAGLAGWLHNNPDVQSFAQIEYALNKLISCAMNEDSRAYWLSIRALIELNSKPSTVTRALLVEAERHLRVWAERGETAFLETLAASQSLTRLKRQLEKQQSGTDKCIDHSPNAANIDETILPIQTVTDRLLSVQQVLGVAEQSLLRTDADLCEFAGRMDNIADTLGSLGLTTLRDLAADLQLAAVQSVLCEDSNSDLTAGLDKLQQAIEFVLLAWARAHASAAVGALSAVMRVGAQRTVPETLSINLSQDLQRLQQQMRIVA